MQKMTSIARAIIMRYGMHEVIGNVVCEEKRQPFIAQTGPRLHERSFSQETAREIDCAARDIVSGTFERMTKLVARHRDVLDTGAARLLKKETLNEPELQVLRNALSANTVTKEKGHV